MKDKKAIRKEIIEYRNSIDSNEKEVFDLKIKKKLIEMDLFKSATNIFIYVGYGSEIDTALYIKEFLNMGKRILIPRTIIKDKVMEAVEITSLDNLIKNKYGILEPDFSLEAFDKNKLDLIILPGVAFDKEGGRVGYGGGYYDKYLKEINSSIKKVALCYDFQIIDKVPSEDHDITADYIISEKNSFVCGR